MGISRGLVLGLLAGLAAALAPAVGQDAARKPALVGTWHVVFERPPGPPGNAIVTFTSDGTSVRTTDRSPVMSPSHGVWAQLNEREFMASWIAFQFDDKGAWIGNQKASFVIRFGADLDNFTGDAEGINTNLEGTVTARIVGPFRGTRVALEPYVAK